MRHTVANAGQSSCANQRRVGALASHLLPPARFFLEEAGPQLCSRIIAAVRSAGSSARESPLSVAQIAMYALPSSSVCSIAARLIRPGPADCNAVCRETHRSKFQQVLDDFGASP